MDLHLALKNIIQTEGENIIKDTKIIHILNDFNAFQNIPASKYILRANGHILTPDAECSALMKMTDLCRWMILLETETLFTVSPSG